MIDHCTLGNFILNKYKRMGVREDSHIYFSRKASFGVVLQVDPLKIS